VNPHPQLVQQELCFCVALPGAWGIFKQPVELKLWTA